MPGDTAFLAVSATALRRNSVEESILLYYLLMSLLELVDGNQVIVAFRVVKRETDVVLL
jgi:hypothetical protein